MDFIFFLIHKIQWVFRWRCFLSSSTNFFFRRYDQQEYYDGGTEAKMMLDAYIHCWWSIIIILLFSYRSFILCTYTDHPRLDLLLFHFFISIRIDKRIFFTKLARFMGFSVWFLRRVLSHTMVEPQRILAADFMKKTLKIVLIIAKLGQAWMAASMKSVLNLAFFGRHRNGEKNKIFNICRLSIVCSALCYI